MVKEIRSETGIRKKQVLLKTIKRAVDSYLSENCDIYGFAYVGDMIISDDLRNLKMFIHFDPQSKNPNSLKIINSRKAVVIEKIKGLIETKFLPKIEILEGEDENLFF